jgi:hypothetical protein
MSDRLDYIARCPTCGKLCCMAVSELDAKELSKSLADWIRRGLSVERMSTPEIRKAPFCKCPRIAHVETDGLKLWKATVEVEVLIASEHRPHDYQIVDAAADEMRDNSLSAADPWEPEEVCSLSDIPESWRESLPRGDNPDDLTCQQIFDAMEERRAEAIRNAPMPNQMELPLP